MDVTTKSPYEEFMEGLQELVDRFGSRMKEWPVGSRSLSFAVAAGLPVKQTYTVVETARYTGLSLRTLYDEHKAGRLKFTLPAGNEKGAVIDVEEMDRWMRENAR